MSQELDPVVGKRIVTDLKGPASHGLRFADSRFWVMHRRREYGPFDYDWSKDFCGVELVYRGQKYGEYISTEEIFADLKEFSLPTTVVEVASIVIGCIIFALLNGLNDAQRNQLMVERLSDAGHENFAQMVFEREGD